MTTMTMSQFEEALIEGYHSYFTLWKGAASPEWMQIFEMLTSTKEKEEQTYITGNGYATAKAEGANYNKDAPQKGFVTPYQHVTYSTGEDITIEMSINDLYGQVAENSPRRIVKSLRDTQEVTHAAVLNEALSTDVLGGDLKPLCSTTHPSAVGAQSNIISSGAATMSEHSLVQIDIDIMNAKDPVGMPLYIEWNRIIVPTALKHTAKRLIESPMQPGTANNDINTFNSFYGDIEVVVLRHLTNPTRFFAQTDIEHGLTHFTRMDMTPDTQIDFGNYNRQNKGILMESHGFTNWQCVWCNG